MEQEIWLVSSFASGVITGVIAMLAFNRLGKGSNSPSQLKREMEDYQTQVEAHFEITSKKFKEMADQYQDLYQHLSAGATNLCRPENIALDLAIDSRPASDDVVKTQEQDTEADGNKLEKDN